MVDGIAWFFAFLIAISGAAAPVVRGEMVPTARAGDVLPAIVDAVAALQVDYGTRPDRHPWMLVVPAAVLGLTLAVLMIRRLRRARD